MNRIIVIVLVMCYQGAFGQTSDEWLRQRRTQRKYLIQQIAALKVYSGHLKEGYDIVIGGLNTIRAIKGGKLDLDHEYLISLRNVNSAFNGSAKVAGIVALQKAIIIELTKLKVKSTESDFLTSDEKHYISDVYSNMVKEADLSNHELERVLSDVDFAMKDDERIGRINMLYVDMKDKYAFTKAFSNSTLLLITQRAKDAHEIKVQETLIREQL